MSTKTACRAKNPETCPYHGIKGLGEPTFANDYTKILDAPLAARIYNKAKAIVDEKLPDMFDDIEGFKEYREIAAHAQAVYDSTVVGQDELSKQIKEADTVAEKEALKSRKEIGEKYREAVLMSRPEIKKSEDNFREIADEHSTAVYEVNPDTITAVADSLSEIEPGTPLVLKTTNGDYIYTTAGTGRIDNKRSFFTYAGFVSGNRERDGSWTSLSLSGLEHRFSLNRVKEIIIAKDYVKPESVLPRLHKNFAASDFNTAKNADRVVLQAADCVIECAGATQSNKSIKIGRTQVEVYKVGENKETGYRVMKPLKVYST